MRPVAWNRGHVAGSGPSDLRHPYPYRGTVRKDGTCPAHPYRLPARGRDRGEAGASDSGRASSTGSGALLHRGGVGNRRGPRTVAHGSRDRDLVSRIPDAPRRERDKKDSPTSFPVFIRVLLVQSLIE